MKPRSITLWLATCALLTCGVGVPAGAAVATAEISQFSIDVVDLDLNDGITAAFTVLPAPTGYNYQELQTIAAPSVFDPDAEAPQDNQYFSTWSDAQSHSAISGAQANARTGGDVFLSADVNTSSVDFAAASVAVRTANLRVTPNTELTISSIFTLSASVNPPCSTLLCERAEVSAGIGLADVADGGMPGTGDGQTVRLLAQPSQPSSSFADLARATLRTFESYAEFQFISRVRAVAQPADAVVVPGIPEPSSYALMLAGLIACAWAVRARRPQ